MKSDFEIVNYVYKNAKMGKESTSSLLKSLENKDNKIVPVVSDILKSYEQFMQKSEKLLSSLSEKGKSFGLAATISADMGIKMQVLKDNSDAAIADMLIKGLTMGEIEMTKMLDTLAKDIDEDIKELVTDFKDFQSNAISKLKKYL